ncbi:MAG: CHC2 zinc finger domain-containing protein, partial [Prochloraceae cyanobacterium]|nr:CHC2 zinc finger domain-containing protein [Prochloraceae cyanobacterium]
LKAEERRQRWLEERDRIKRQKQKQKEFALSVEERDRIIREIIEQLDLSPDDRENIKRNRHLSDYQIEARGYRSLKPWQKLSRAVDDRLAGVKLGGRSLLNFAKGIFCPIQNAIGLYVGFQWRPDNPIPGKGKYLWPAGESKRDPQPKSNLANGELPLSVNYPERYSQLYLEEGAIGFCDSVAFKGHTAANFLGIPIIGASGGHFASSSETLRIELQNLKTKEIIVYPDAGDIKNPLMMTAINKAIAKVKSWGYPVKIAWWGQVEKSVGDIDEISRDKIAKITYLTPNEFNELVKPDIVRVIGEKITLTKRGKSHMGICPFHSAKNGDLTETLIVESERDRYWCTECGASGNKDRFKSDWDKLSESEKQRQWQQQKQQSKQQKQEQKKQFLSVAKRDRAIRHVLAQLTLTEQHRWHLKQNLGLTDEQIEKKGYKSVAQWQKLNQPVDDLLAGVKLGGQFLLTPESGILCPVPDYQGRFVTWQFQFDLKQETKADDNPSTESQHLWAAGERSRTNRPSSHLPWGELPFAVNIPNDPKNNNIVGLCAGVDHRPQIASDKLNIPFIGAEKSLFASSPITLKLYLKKLGRFQVVFYPEPGSVYDDKTLIAYNKTISLLEKWGYAVTFAWWGQTKKSASEIGQLSDHQIEEIKYLTPAEFRSIAAKEQYKQKCWQTWYDKKRFTADVELNSRYFKYDLPESGTMTFIKSPLGTGKTTQLIEWLRILDRFGIGAISLGYRNTLLIQFCSKANEKDPENDIKPLGVYHINEDRDASKFLNDPASKIASCINSILKYEAEDFEGKILIIDEVVSVLKHLLYSGTIKHFSRVLDRFSEAIRRADRVICLDGFLADWVVDYFATICPEKKIAKVHNNYAGSKPKVYYLEGALNLETQKIKKNDRTPWLEHLLEQSQIPAICSDSQIFIEGIDELLLAKGVKTLRADSKTAPTKWVKEFLKDPEKYIRQNQIEAILYTPTAESGLDIKITNYFTEHFAFFFGVLDVDSIIQMIGRLRDVNVPRYLWVKQFIFPEDGKSSEREIDIAKLQAIRYQNMIAEAALVHQSDDDLELKLKRLEAIYQKNIDPHAIAADVIKTIWNFEKPNLRQCVKEILKGNHYLLESIVAAASFKTVGDLEKDAKGAVKERNARDFFNASDRRINDNDLSVAFDASWETRCEVIKAWLVKSLPGINQTQIWSPEFIKFIKYDRPQLIKQLTSFYLLKNPEIAQKIAADAYHRIFERDKNGEKIPPWKLRQQYLRIHTLIEIGLLQLINNPDEIYTADHHAIAAIVKKCQQPEIAAILGKPGKCPIKYVGRLIRSLGLNWSEVHKQVNGNKFRGYKLKLEDLDQPEYLAILNAIERKHQKYDPQTWQKPVWNFDEVRSQKSEVRNMNAQLASQNETQQAEAPIENSKINDKSKELLTSDFTLLTSSSTTVDPQNVYTSTGQSVGDCPNEQDIETQPSKPQNSPLVENEVKTDLTETGLEVEPSTVDPQNIYTSIGQSVGDCQNEPNIETEPEFNPHNRDLVQLMSWLSELEFEPPVFSNCEQVNDLMGQIQSVADPIQDELLTVCPDYYYRCCDAMERLFILLPEKPSPDLIPEFIEVEIPSDEDIQVGDLEEIRLWRCEF